MPSETNDAILVERAQKGDRAAIDTLIVRYQGKAYQFAYRLAGNMDDASDLVAESFVRVYSAMPRFRREAQFSTWLYRIITNCFLDQRKREKNRQHQSLDDALAVNPDQPQTTATSGESPSEASERGERERIIKAAVERLPEYQRAMIVMYHVENLSYEDIASALDLPVGTVKSRLNRARLSLREALEPYEELFRA